jgi:hypothetical protein
MCSSVIIRSCCSAIPPKVDAVTDALVGCSAKHSYDFKAPIVEL